MVGRGEGIIPDCPREHTIVVNLMTAVRSVQVLVEVGDCRRNRKRERIHLANVTWNPDETPFPDIRVGETTCRNFRIEVANGTYMIDSISLPPDLPVVFEEKLKFPVSITNGIFHYKVCFTGKAPGIYVFHVTAWIRRDEPAGGYTNYPVTDTGVIRVLQ